jgi:hypothetical protein
MKTDVIEEQSMKQHRPVVSIVASIFLAACGDPISPVAGGPSIKLSAQQAATVTSRITQLAPVHPELAWLGDSISLVIKTGVEVDSVDLATDLGAGPFYAIALQRAITTSINATATFDVILFNNPSNPTDFIIADGWSQLPVRTPPTSVSGAFGAQLTNSGVTAHLFHVAGGAVTAWRAATGTAAFTSGAEGGACPSFTATSGVTCSTTGLHASFVIGSATHDNGSSADSRSASLVAVDVPGILLKILIP